MTIEFGLTNGNTNTAYAPLVALFAYYQCEKVFLPLEQVANPAKERDFTLSDKLIQILLSIMAGCTTLSEVNFKLKQEIGLVSVWGWKGIADQSSLSRTLDGLSLKQIEEIRQAITEIWRTFSQAYHHNWHGYLCLDFDLSGLPCSAQAEASQKGFFSDKKTPRGGN